MMRFFNKRIAGTLLGLLILSSLIFVWSNKPVQGHITSRLDSETDTQDIFLPIVTKNYDPTLGIPLFGVQMYGDTTVNSPYYDLLLESNTSWVRIPISWASVEPIEQSPAQYNWTAVDKAFAVARTDAVGLNLIGTIETSPEWARDLIDSPSPRGPIKPDKMNDFAAFVGALIERYDGDGIDDAPGSPIIDYWELYNEPDSGDTFPDASWGSYGAEYAQMLSYVYPAAKNANPQAQIVMGGLAYDWFEDQNGPFVRDFIDDVLASGGGAYFDVMNFHYYPGFSPNWTDSNGLGLVEKANVIRDVLAQYGWSKPTIMTEAGWHDNASLTRPSTPEKQKRYLVQLYVQSMASNIDVMIWWMLYDIGGDYPFDTGIVTKYDNEKDPPVEQKESFTTYQNIVAELSNAHFIRTLSVTETGNDDVEAHEFQDNTRRLTIYTAWLNPVDASASAPLKVPAHEATVRDSVTNSTYTRRDADDGVADGFVTVYVTGRPVYIEVAQ